MTHGETRRARRLNEPGAGTGEVDPRAPPPRRARARAPPAVPILMYHVIAAPPAGAPFPGLYVTPKEFAEQMHALTAAGWHAVTLDQVAANWSNGAPLGPGKPIVLSFDNGYQSQYTHALPVLRELGWVGDENIQLTGLPPSQGGLEQHEVRGLLAAGWELDTQGLSHADLTTLDGSAAITGAVAREILRSATTCRSTGSATPPATTTRPWSKR